MQFTRGKDARIQARHTPMRGEWEYMETYPLEYDYSLLRNLGGFINFFIKLMGVPCRQGAESETFIRVFTNVSQTTSTDLILAARELLRLTDEMDSSLKCHCSRACEPDQ
ncbi:hypothetical protein ONZ45_g8344 [Pleurotus djamor]|nr:hypothetical protein ONZ45_g8344 [Pleurotus djamor]